MSSQDQTPVLSSFSSDPEMLELVEEFVSVLPERVSAIQSAVDGSDLESVTRLAHQLKGASGGYGFDTIGEAAANLERSAKAAEAVAQLQDEVEALISLCQRARVSG